MNATAHKKTDTRLLGFAQAPLDFIEILPTAVEPVFNVNCYTWLPRGPANAGDPLPTDHVRVTSSVFFVGMSERMVVRQLGGGGWLHRRIIFQTYQIIGLATPPSNSSQGIMRSGALFSTLDASNIPVPFVERLFSGTYSFDWRHIMSAKVDSRRVRVISDKTRKLNVANDTNRLHITRYWLPCGRTIIYDEDERGTGQVDPGTALTSSPWAADTRLSGGNYYVADFWEPTSTAQGGSLQVEIEGKAYWHER